MHHIAVLDDVFFALQTKKAFVARAGFSAAGHKVIVGNGLGADETLFKISVDHSGRFGSQRSFFYCPSSGLFRTGG